MAQSKKKGASNNKVEKTIEPIQICGYRRVNEEEEYLVSYGGGSSSNKQWKKAGDLPKYSIYEYHKSLRNKPKEEKELDTVSSLYSSRTPENNYKPVATHSKPVYVDKNAANSSSAAEKFMAAMDQQGLIDKEYNELIAQSTENDADKTQVKDVEPTVIPKQDPEIRPPEKKILEIKEILPKTSSGQAPKMPSPERKIPEIQKEIVEMKSSGIPPAQRKNPEIKSEIKEIVSKTAPKITPAERTIPEIEKDIREKVTTMSDKQEPEMQNAEKKIPEFKKEVKEITKSTSKSEAPTNEKKKIHDVDITNFRNSFDEKIHGIRLALSSGNEKIFRYFLNQRRSKKRVWVDESAVPISMKYDYLHSTIVKIKAIIEDMKNNPNMEVDTKEMVSPTGLRSIFDSLKSSNATSPRNTESLKRELEAELRNTKRHKAENHSNQGVVDLPDLERPKKLIQSIRQLNQEIGALSESPISEVAAPHTPILNVNNTLPNQSIFTNLVLERDLYAGQIQRVRPDTQIADQPIQFDEILDVINDPGNSLESIQKLRKSIVTKLYPSSLVVNVNRDPRRRYQALTKDNELNADTYPSTPTVENAETGHHSGTFSADFNQNIDRNSNPLKKIFEMSSLYYLPKYSTKLIKPPNE